jgi:hypothetical protein
MELFVDSVRTASLLVEFGQEAQESRNVLLCKKSEAKKLWQSGGRNLPRLCFVGGFANSAPWLLEIRGKGAIGLENVVSLRGLLYYGGAICATASQIELVCGDEPPRSRPPAARLRPKRSLPHF